MKDLLGREIDYMRISIIDRCNLRCKYCMPNDIPVISHDEVLRYEEILEICKVAVNLGINRYKITGGEPFVRKGAADFMTRLKLLPGVKCVTVTTNGTMTEEIISLVKASGIDGINISIDAVDPLKYAEIAGLDYVSKVLSTIEKCAQLGINTKVNCVLLKSNSDQILPLVSLAENLPVDVRFIELMPIGYGKNLSGPDFDIVFPVLQEAYPDLVFSNEKRGNGPAFYYKTSKLRGRIGFITANSHKFCGSCNRIRLTSNGQLKTCLCYDSTLNLKEILRSGAALKVLEDELKNAVLEKPSTHCFSKKEKITESKEMCQIGG